MRPLLPPRLFVPGVIVHKPVPARKPHKRKDQSRTAISALRLLPPPTLGRLTPTQLPVISLTFPSPPTQPTPPPLALRMGRRRTKQACATIPSMLSSARGAPELHPAAADAEVSAAAAGATGSEAACPGDRGGRNRGGRDPAATSSSTGVTEGAEHLGDSPAGQPDPEPGRMDYHQPGTGRYQVVSSWPPPRPPAPLGDPRLSPTVPP